LEKGSIGAHPIGQLESQPAALQKIGIFPN